MKKYLQILSLFIALNLLFNVVKAQNIYIPADTTATNNLNYTFFNGSFASFGCNELDPTFWLSGNTDSVLINFVTPQNNPSIRVWGMNDDDSAAVSVNAIIYPLTSTSATYDDKVLCSTVYPSPGPDGVVFSNGLLVGANSNSLGNYTYQNVTLLSSNVSSIQIVGKSGNGWGFDGVTISDPISSTISNLNFGEPVKIFPNPTNGVLNLELSKNDKISDIKVFDLLGKSIYKQENAVSNNIELDLSQYANGIYLISFRMKDSIIFKRIIKR